MSKRRFFYSIAFSCLLLLSCNTAVKDSKPSNLAQTLAQADIDWSKYTRSGKVYHQFTLDLSVDAIYFAASLKQKITAENPRAIDQGLIKEPQAEPEKATGELLEFVVMIYWPQQVAYSTDDFRNAWDVQLISQDDQLLPISFTKINRKEPIYRFLSYQYGGISRWVTPFLVRFAHPIVFDSSSDAPSVEQTNIQLQFSGAAGQTTLSWNEALAKQ